MSVVIIDDLTFEEARLIREGREEKAADASDLAALQAILPRAKCAAERHELEKMIARRSGPRVATCRCGQPVPCHGNLECDDCYSLGYGK